MEQVKNAFFWILGAAVIIWSFYMFLNQPAPAKYQHAPVVRVGDHPIKVEVADTDLKRTLGLSGRESLPVDSGLLFAFEIPGKYSFWMKDMRFSIDIIWIDQDWNVVRVDRAVSPATFPQTYMPPVDIKYVLEINSGEASSLGIDTGTRLYFDTKN